MLVPPSVSPSDSTYSNKWRILTEACRTASRGLSNNTRDTELISSERILDRTYQALNYSSSNLSVALKLAVKLERCHYLPNISHFITIRFLNILRSYAKLKNAHVTLFTWIKYVLLSEIAVAYNKLRTGETGFWKPLWFSVVIYPIFQNQNHFENVFLSIALVWNVTFAAIYVTLPSTAPRQLKVRRVKFTI
jgi:hypothetical protein